MTQSGSVFHSPSAAEARAKSKKLEEVLKEMDVEASDELLSFCMHIPEQVITDEWNRRFLPAIRAKEAEEREKAASETLEQRREQLGVKAPEASPSKKAKK